MWCSRPLFVFGFSRLSAHMPVQAFGAQGSLEKPGTLLCEREDFDRIRPSIPAEPISD